MHRGAPRNQHRTATRHRFQYGQPPGLVLIGEKKIYTSVVSGEKLKVLDPAEAAKWADVVMVLTPDEGQGDLYREKLGPNLKSGSALAFAVVKVGLAAGAVVLLTLLASLRLLGRLSAGALLPALLAGYGALIVYEFSLLGLL